MSPEERSEMERRLVELIADDITEFALRDRESLLEYIRAAENLPGLSEAVLTARAEFNGIGGSYVATGHAPDCFLPRHSGDCSCGFQPPD